MVYTIKALSLLTSNKKVKNEISFYQNTPEHDHQSSDDIGKNVLGEKESSFNNDVDLSFLGLIHER